MTRQYVSLLVKVGVIATSVIPLLAFQTNEPRTAGEVQIIDLVPSPEAQVLANTRKAFRQGDIVRITDENPLELQRLLGVGGVMLTTPVRPAGTPFSFQDSSTAACRIVAVRSTKSGALHEFMQLGSKSSGTAFQKWAEKEAQLAINEVNGNASTTPTPPAQAWTELQQTTISSTDGPGNVFQNTISIYRLNDISPNYDWYMVLTDPESQPKYGGCGVFGTGSCGWWTSQRVFTMSTVPQSELVDHGPLNTITSSQAGFSIGGSIGFTGPGVTADFSQSWQQPSVTTTDQSDLTNGVSKWNEAFQGQGIFGSTPPETSTGLFLSHQGSIFRVPEGTTAFQFTLDEPVTSEFQPHFGNPSTNAQDPTFQVNVFPPVFSASLTTLSIPPGGKGAFEITAVNPSTSNAGLGLAWNITNLPPWLTVSQNSGSGSTIITLNVLPGTALGSVGSINLDTNPQFAAPSVEVNPLLVRVTVGQPNDTGIMLAGGFNSQSAPQNVADLFSPQLGAFDFETKMQSPRANQTASLLISGQLLLTGGFTAPRVVTSGAELFDPQTATFTATAGVMPDERVFHTASLLANGTVLVAGGVDTNGYSNSGDALATADVYDPVSQTFKPVGPMVMARIGHTSTLLQNGTVLIVGGQQNITQPGGTDTAEIFDSASNEFSLTTGKLVSQLFAHKATLLKDGHVLVTGGYGNNGVTNLAQLYNPATKTFTAVGNLNVARTDHTATLLADGTVLIAGGNDKGANALATAEIYDPETHAFTLLSGGASCPGNPGCMSAARADHTATAELNGTVFLAGGRNPNSGATLGSTEIYNPVTKTFTAGPNTTPRAWHTATLLQRPASTVTLASSANPSAVGQKITLVAVVKTGGAAPNGTVTFFDKTTQLGSAPLQASGQALATASFSTSSLSPGSHSLTAAYSGDINHGRSTSSVLVQSVKTQPTITTLHSSVNPSKDGQLVTFTAAVSAAGGGTPTGTVTFRSSGTVLGTSPLTGNTAAFGTSTLGNGSNAITATYNGSANFASSSSPVLTQNVSKLATTISLSANPNPANFGQNVLLNAAVKSTGSAPSGTVTFNDGNKTLQTVPLISGLASLTLSSLSVGSHSLTAIYSGDLTHGGVTSTPVTERITADPVTVTTSSSLNPSFYGQNVVFTAAVRPATGSSTPTGTVTFLDGASSLGTVPLTVGVATFPTSALTGGTHLIRASYNGDSSHAKNVSAPVTQTVNAVPTTTTVSSSLNPSKVGQSVIFTAIVRGGPNMSAPAGIVTFYDGQNVLGTPGLSGGIASLPVSTLSAGPHNITAAYGGSRNFAVSTSSILVQNVQAVKTTTSTTLGSSANPSKPAQSVQFTATVTSSSGTPTGSVLFTDGRTSLGPGVLKGGQAVFSTTNLSVGRHSIVATYAGDATHTGSSSMPLVQNVAGLVTPHVALTVQPNVAKVGAPLTFTATVSYPGGPVPTGSVNISEGATSYGTAPLISGVGKVVTSNIPVGRHSILSTYGGDGGSFYNGAQSSSVSVMIQGTGEPPPATPSVAVSAILQAPANGLVPLQLTIANNGTVNAGHLQLDQLLLRTLAGTGQASLVSPSTPISAGSLKPGASTALILQLRIPSGVHKLLLTENGALHDAAGKVYRFSPSQIVFPRQR